MFVCQGNLTLIAKTIGITGISSSCFSYRGFKIMFFSQHFHYQSWTDSSGICGKGFGKSEGFRALSFLHLL